METFLIGAVIITTSGVEGMIVDKARGHSDGSTIYIIINKEGIVHEVEHDEIREVLSFGGNPSQYMILKTKK
jgi:hypothetical protein